MKEVVSVIGTNVRNLRLQQGFSQERLADRVSLSSDYLSRLELGKGNPTVGVLHRISSALGVRITSLFENIPPRD
jgi:transcriptional regulator with XRE-family HTH domain